MKLGENNWRPIPAMVRRPPMVASPWTRRAHLHATAWLVPGHYALRSGEGEPFLSALDLANWQLLPYHLLVASVEVAVSR